jgi:hypothetical protein
MVSYYSLQHCMLAAMPRVDDYGKFSFVRPVLGRDQDTRKLSLFACFRDPKGCRSGIPALPVTHEIP